MELDIKVSPVENTEAYKNAMKEIQPQLDELPEWVTFQGMNALKKRLLAEKGIEWQSIIELNPDIRFD